MKRIGIALALALMGVLASPGDLVFRPTTHVQADYTYLRAPCLRFCTHVLPAPRAKCC